MINQSLSIVLSDGYCEKDMRSRIAIAKQAFMNETGKWDIELKKIIIKCTVWSIVLYGAVTWTMMQADQERLSAFEMWVWGRIEKISWIDRVTSDEVLQRVQETRSILDTVRQCKLRWIGHILRHDSLLRDIVESRMIGKATRGQSTYQCLATSQAKTAGL